MNDTNSREELILLCIDQGELQWLTEYVNKHNEMHVGVETPLEDRVTSILNNQPSFIRLIVNKVASQISIEFTGSENSKSSVVLHFARLALINNCGFLQLRQGECKLMLPPLKSKIVGEPRDFIPYSSIQRID